MVPTSKDRTFTNDERKEFVDHLVVNSSLLKKIRRVTMRRSRVEIPCMALGTRVANDSHAYKETPKENVEKYFDSLTLISSKVTLPWPVTPEFLEGNSAREKLVTKMMAIQVANDLEDLSINGDESSTDPLMKANNGFLKLAERVVTVKRKEGDSVSNVLETLIRELPAKYRQDLKKLKFFVSPDFWMDYVEAVSNRMGELADQFLVDNYSPTYQGIDFVMSPFMPSDCIILTNQDNLVFGMEEDIVLSTLIPTKNTGVQNEIHHELHTRCDFQIQIGDALVLGIVTIPAPVHVRAIRWVKSLFLIRSK